METFHPTSRKFNIYICAPLKLNNSSGSRVKNGFLTWIDREHSPTIQSSDTLDSTVGLGPVAILRRKFIVINDLRCAKHLPKSRYTLTLLTSHSPLGIEDVLIIFMGHKFNFKTFLILSTEMIEH